MKTVTILCAALGAASIATPVLAAPPVQPPMNDFSQAFYKCDGGDAFMMSYDSDKPESAKMRTNDDNKLHVLKRTPSASGVQFAGDNISFWTDGKTVVVKGAAEAFRNCKTKVS
jgi:membrane-bound inhibitor of C-type lysozyme